jgi:hypothetical protein
MRSIRTFRVAVSFVIAGLGIGGAESLSAQFLSQNLETVSGSVVRTAVTQDLVAQRARLDQMIAAFDWDAADFRRTFAALDRLIAGDGVWLPERARPFTDTPSGGSGSAKTAKALVTSESGRAWLRKRREVVERSFPHVLDCGAGRRTTF